MDFVGTMLITLTPPSGFWVNILNAFKGALGTYMLAVILLAVIVRVVFSIVDIVNKKVNLKNMQINEKMKPELEAVQKKYGHDKVLLQQKQSEIYKKYQFNMLGSCLPMLVMLILQMVVFLTLWSSLQSVANFNIASQYENTKTVYANVLLLNENTDDISVLFKTKLEQAISSNQEYSVEVALDLNSETPHMDLTIVYSDGGKEGVFTFDINKSLDNATIYNLIENYAYEPSGDEEISTESLTDLNKAIKKLANEVTADYYLANQEGFLWIKNIYKSESPSSPVFTKSEIVNYLSGFYSEDEKTLEAEHKYEENIFDYVVAGINERDVGVNGYYILVILAVITSFLSVWLSNKLMKNNSASAGQGKMMYFVMPIILGIFTLMYTSLFAIYIIVGQIVMIALTPLTNLIVKKWNEASLKKKKDKDVVEVDYRRK